MDKTNCEKKIIKRLFLVTATCCIFVVVVAFLNFQCDDELYFGTYEYTNVSDYADYSDGVITVSNTMGASENAVIAETPAIHVDAGRFIYDLDHQNDYDMKAVIYDGHDEVGVYQLPANEVNTRIEFNSVKNIYNLRIVFLYPGKGVATIKRGILYSVGRPFYYDTALYAILVILAILSVAFFLVRTDFFGRDNVDKLLIGAVILFLILINYLYFRPFSTGGTDTAYHVSRMEATYNELQRGHFPVVMYADALHGRGMIGILYPYMLLLLPAALRMMHISVDGAMRVFYIFINFSTCITSYYSAKRITGSKKMAAYFMMLYGLLLYRITTMTYRYACGETQAFIFMPLIILGLYELLVEEKPKWIMLVIGMTGLIQCHIVSTLQAIVICIVFGVLFLDVLIKERRIIQVGIAAATTLLMNLWYIVPFVTYYQSDVDTETHLANGNLSYITYYMTDVLRLFPNTATGNQSHHQMGMIGLWLIVLVASAVYREIKKQEYDIIDRFSITSIVLGLIFVFMTTKFFPWATMEKFTAIYSRVMKIQFSTRLYLGGESLLLFGSMMSFIETSHDTCKRKQIHISSAGIMAVISLMIVAVFQAYAITDKFIEGMDPFVDVRISRFTANIYDQFVDDYVPEGYWDDEEGFPNAPQSPVANIADYSHNDYETRFTYVADSETYADIPLIYYIGYEAHDEDGTELPIEKGTHASVRVLLPQSTGNTVNVEYKGFENWRLATTVSVVTFFVVLLWGIYNVYRDNTGQYGLVTGVVDYDKDNAKGS